MAIALPDGRCESNEVLEALRLRAVHARELGYVVIDIAAVLGVREETISRWCSRYDRGGREALPGIAPDDRSAPVASSTGNRSKASGRRSRPRPRSSWGSPRRYGTVRQSER